MLRRSSFGNTYFNPLSPHGERPCLHGEGLFCPSYFNPLSPHGERLYRLRAQTDVFDFNPLSPHGERLDILSRIGSTDTFQSTLPAWGETAYRVPAGDGREISIHSPRMGRDHLIDIAAPRLVISIHSPRMGRDPMPRIVYPRKIISIHSPRMGRDVSSA